MLQVNFDVNMLETRSVSIQFLLKSLGSRAQIVPGELSGCLSRPWRYLHGGGSCSLLISGNWSHGALGAQQLVRFYSRVAGWVAGGGMMKLIVSQWIIPENSLLSTSKNLLVNKSCNEKSCVQTTFVYFWLEHMVTSQERLVVQAH